MTADVPPSGGPHSSKVLDTVPNPDSWEEEILICLFSHRIGLLSNLATFLHVLPLFAVRIIGSMGCEPFLWFDNFAGWTLHSLLMFSVISLVILKHHCHLSEKACLCGSSPWMLARPSFRDSIISVLILSPLEILNCLSIKFYLSGQEILVTKNSCPKVLRELSVPYHCDTNINDR